MLFFSLSKDINYCRKLVVSMVTELQHFSIETQMFFAKCITIPIGRKLIAIHSSYSNIAPMQQFVTAPQEYSYSLVLILKQRDVAV